MPAQRKRLSRTTTSTRAISKPGGAAGIVGELASLLRDLRRVEMRTLPPSQTLAARSAAGELEARLAALAELDALDVEKKLKLFG